MILALKLLEAHVQFLEKIQRPDAKDIEADVDTLHNSVDRIDQKLDDMIEKQSNEDDVMNNIDMECGDSSDEYVMWIGDNGDTIWE